MYGFIWNFLCTMYAALSAVDVAPLTHIYDYHICFIRLTLMAPPFHKLEQKFRFK